MLAKYLIICLSVNLQYHLVSTSDSCESKTTCAECISVPSVCVWCAENETKDPRCRAQGSYEDSWCKTSRQNPKNEQHASVPKEFSSDKDHVVQLKPQLYKLKLRPGEPETFNFSFQSAKNYPVDLYFLLDASKTMVGIKNMTATQSQNIYLTIKQMTDNVHLGYGTFIDKRMLPFTNNTLDTELTYSFRHRLKLVDNFTRFKEEVSNTASGNNRDNQEGGLDALAQVMACESIIGWRTQSRKIIVFLTDGPYHAAGDGKSAGLFEPYDGECYTKNGTYTKELEMDYPSVGMINKLASDRDIIIIFLVEDSVEYIYNGLSRAVSGSRISTYKRKANMNNDAIVTLLKDIYEKISKKIKLNTKVKSKNKKNVKISFEPDCTIDSKDCVVEIGKERELVGTIQYNHTENCVIDIAVEGIGEKITLEIDVIKNCDCDRTPELNSTHCYGERRVCGICDCSDNRYGERCACVKSGTNLYKDNSTCVAEGSIDICSGHGTCSCGICQCRDSYEGKFCQCNKNSCPRSTGNKEVCNGHGKCNCGKCTCEDKWIGDACDCYNTDAYCKDDKDNICHNRGQCVCGKCQCDQFAEWDARTSQDTKCQMHCQEQDPSVCHELQCRKLTDCARCKRSKGDECLLCDERIQTILVPDLTEEHLNSSLWNNCGELKVEIGCTTNFVYRYNDTNYSMELVVAENANCAQTYYAFGGFFLLTLLLIGAGTLIAWKLLTEARDRHEYAQFMQQNQMDSSGPSCNPLYAPPSSTFNNPAFRKKSDAR